LRRSVADLIYPGAVATKYVQIMFNGWKTIDHVIVYTLQDILVSTVEPTDILTFGNYGVTAFTVQAGAARTG
jgi:hypothetical protein